MTVHSKLLLAIYMATSVIALVLTWVHIPHYMAEGMMSANAQFWADAIFHSNPAGRFLAIDVFFVTFSANVWMVTESRRYGIKFVWAYVLAGLIIAISVALPLFLAARELRFSSAASDELRAELKLFDVWGLVLIFAVSIGAGMLAF